MLYDINKEFELFKKEVEPKFSKKNIGIEKLILSSIYRYRVLNKYNLQRIIRDKTHKDIEITHILSDMAQNGLLWYYLPREENRGQNEPLNDLQSEPSLKLYELSKFSFDYVQTDMKLDKHYEFKERYTTAELISLVENAQFNIGLITDAGLKKVSVHKYISNRNIYIPTEAMIGKRPLVAISINEPKFILKLMEIAAYYSLNTYLKPIYVFIGNSNRQIIEIYKKLTQTGYLKNIDFLYCLNYNTKYNPLKYIYSIEIEESKIKISSVNISKKEP